MTAFTASVILEGRSIPSQTPVRLNAGPLKMLLEPASGFLRQIKRGGELVLNGIYAAVRDQNWGTVEPELHHLKINQQPDTFAVTFTAVCRSGDIHFIWEGRITGDAQGTIRYEFNGEAKTTFLRNRIGFCILHDADCAGRPCVVEHVDGTRTDASFPRLISPHQPFKELRSITHNLEGRHSCRPDEEKNIENPENGGGTPHPDPLPFRRGEGEETYDPVTTTITVRMEGGVFEMEDQRNWTDASFKTYCTPLERPFPVRVKLGERLHQSVELRCHDEVGGPHSSRPSDQSVCQGDRRPVLPPPGEFQPLPRLGLGMASHELPLNEHELDRLRPLQLDHLRFDLTPLADGWEIRWQKAVADARALNARLHVALHLDDRAEKQLAAVAQLPATELVAAWLVFRRGERATSARWTELARQHLTRYDGLIVGGTDAYFAELNRNRPDLRSADAVSWSLNPQVHAFDNLSLVETLETQWQTVLSARELFDGGLMISPVTLRPRFNPNATAVPSPVPPDVLPPEVDVRQMSLLGAAWTLGSIASLSRAPWLRTITYFETTGWRGVMEWSDRPRLPHKFVTRPGWVFPVYFVFALLAGHDECRRLDVLDPLRQTALLIRSRRMPGVVRLLAANLDREPGLLEWPAGFTPDRKLVLDQENAVAAMRDPVAHLNSNWSPVKNGPPLWLPSLALVALDGLMAAPVTS